MTTSQTTWQPIDLAGPAIRAATPRLTADPTRLKPWSLPVVTRAELAECTCPCACERDHDLG